jgi:hypothetical protein
MIRNFTLEIDDSFKNHFDYIKIYSTAALTFENKLNGSEILFYG